MADRYGNVLLLGKNFSLKTLPQLSLREIVIIGTSWINSTTEPGWIWQGDTSSDQVTGHMFVYHVFYDLVAETPDEKKRAFQAISRIFTRFLKSYLRVMMNVVSILTKY